MKDRSSTAVAFPVLALFFLFFTASSGTGSLSFLTLSSTIALQRSADEYSSLISTNSGGFPFGDDVVYAVFVSSNGYISMGAPPLSTFPAIPKTNNIASPYGAHIDTSLAGRVRYMPFTSNNSQLTRVNTFIESQTGFLFSGTTMMVAEWDHVAKYGGSSGSTSTFQAVLITDGTVSYAVFIYECGGMEWGAATIGWAYSNEVYEEHPLSQVNSSHIGCEYSTSCSAVVYRLNPCSSSEFTCGNGDCVYSNFVCDGLMDCEDNSDEELECDAGNETNAIVAGGFGIFLICLAVFLFCCSVLTDKFKRHLRTCDCLRQTSGARIINAAIETQNSAAPTPHTTIQPLVPIGTLSSTVVSNEQEPAIIQREYKDAQLSSGEAPPSYEDAAAYPSYVAPNYLQYQSVPCYPEMCIPAQPQSQAAACQ